MNPTDDAQLKSDSDRQDAEHKREEDRADTQLKVDNARQDTEHKREEDRADTELALKNARWDAEHKRDEDRDDTELALINARWDADHQRDEDRKDTAEALKHSREDTALAVDWTLFEAVHAGYIAVAQSSLDRSIQRATYVTTAAASVVTLYTGLLAFRFSATGKGSMLPARSLIPALFLGAAVVFSTFYIAFLRRQTMVSEMLPSGQGGNIVETRLLSYLEWVSAGIIARAWSLRLSVISLGFGLILLPIGFVNLSTNTGTILGAVAAGLLVLWIAGEVYLALYVAKTGKPPSFMDMFTGKPRFFADQTPYLPPRPPAKDYAPEPLQGPRLTAPDQPSRSMPSAPADAAGNPPAAPADAAGNPPAASAHNAGKDAG